MSGLARLPLFRRHGVVLILLAALIILIVGAVLLVRPRAASDQEDPSVPRLSIHSNEKSGARALYVWLAELGYRPKAIEFQSFAVDRQSRVLFVMAPSGGSRDGSDTLEPNANAIVEWVERGGTLVVVSERPNSLLKRLGVDVLRVSPQKGEAYPQQPVAQPFPLRRIEAKAPTRLWLQKPEWVPLIGTSDGDVLAAVSQVGSGRAYVLSSTYPLSNAGLGQADNWMLPLQFLASVPQGSTLAFDEYHHGLTEHGSLVSRLVGEPWGWAILYAAALLFLFVAIRGRRFGRAVPVQAGLARRSRGEYVATVAGLLRQGRHRGWLREQYVDQVKRALGSRYRLSPALPSREFVAALSSRRPDAAALANPLGRLERDVADDATIVRLMVEVQKTCTRLGVTS